MKPYNPESKPTAKSSGWGQEQIVFDNSGIEKTKDFRRVSYGVP